VRRDPTEPESGPRPGGARALLAGLFLSLVSIALCLGALEAAFRLAPSRLLPSGSYVSGRLDPTLGVDVHAAPALYTRNGFVRRVPNREGFLDVEHDARPAPGVTRIGVFGDSYVEAQQVPLESTFFRRAQDRLGPGTEWLAFGFSGWGTLQAYRAFEAFAPRDDLSIAVYLFVENDPGDNDFILKTQAVGSGRPLPGALLSADRDSWEERSAVTPGSEPLWYPPAKWLHRHSLLAHVVVDRLAILRRRGVQVREDRALREMRGVARGAPDVNDLPPSWPPEDRARVERLGWLLLRDWKRAADARHTDLIVLYVPRGNDQLSGVIAESDTWLPWLRATCADLGLPLVDPTAALREAFAEGRAVYADHWTAAGHDVVAGVLADAVRPHLRTAYR
jgi:hypothetical protein